MREIKFRGWHSQAKRMFSAEEMAKDQLTLLTTGSFINVHGNDTGKSVIYSNEKFIPMQFTGLNDKNGIEIYEGDVYSWDYEYDSDYDGDMPIVKRSAGRGHVKDIFDTWRIKEAAKEGKGVEVIGNIYENPTLILTNPQPSNPE